MKQLETQRLVLRPFQGEDAADLYEYAKDPRVGLPAGWPPHKSQAESLEIIRTVFAAPNNELGYALSPAYWGQGLMPEAAEELLRYAFEEMDLAAVWCSHYGDNPQSQRVIEKCGFVFQFEETVVDEPTGEQKPTKFSVLTREQWAGAH